MQKGLAIPFHSGACLLAQERKKVVEKHVSSELGKSTLFGVVWSTRLIWLNFGVLKKEFTEKQRPQLHRELGYLQIWLLGMCQETDQRWSLQMSVCTNARSLKPWAVSGSVVNRMLTSSCDQMGFTGWLRGNLGVNPQIWCLRCVTCHCKQQECQMPVETTSQWVTFTSEKMTEVYSQDWGYRAHG